MKSISPNADVWFVQDEQVILFRQRDQVWVIDLKLSFQDFLGSAVALSSFTLPDTCVVLNVGTTHLHSTSEFNWVGLAEDPLRCIYIGETNQTREQLRELKTLGKPVYVVSVEKPEQFTSASPLHWINADELKHFKNWIRDKKNGLNPLHTHLILYYRLWMKPGQRYQIFRCIALLTTLFCLAMTHWHTQQQFNVLSKNLHDQQQRSVMQISHIPIQIPITHWLEQISKFGTNQRANLTALNVYWNADGEIQTIVNLNRERKRVPKGCELTQANRAVCKLKSDKP
jgi:hypothetical protein